MNALQLALVDAGLAKPPKERKWKPRSFNCFKCHGENTMHPIENTNTMVCENCGNYYIFKKDN